MKAILVDDEPDGIGTLKRLLQWHCPEVEIIATCSNAVTAKQQIEMLKPEVVFLDIQMPGKTGLELLGELSSRQCEVIFVTAYNEYMLQALQYSAADYLLKPVDEDRLLEAVQHVARRLNEDRNDGQAAALLHNLSKATSMAEMRLCLPTLKGFVVVKLEEIIYCEAERSYTVFHLQSGKTVTVSKPLLDYDHLLRDTSFLRIHKSFLVNLLHVKEYQKGEGGLVIMTNNDEIEVSRRKKDEFLVKVKEAFKY